MPPIRTLAIAIGSVLALLGAGCGAGPGTTTARLAGAVASTQPTTTAPPTTTTDPTTITTEAPTTTTTSIADALRAALDVTAQQVFVESDNGDRSILVPFALHNVARRAISAFQFTAIVSATDKLGRTFTRNLLFDCTDAPLAPGSSRSAGMVHYSGDNIDQLIAASDRQTTALDNCTLGAWDVNQYIDNQMSMFEAILGGTKATVAIQLNRVVFADGSAIGTAKNGSPL